MQRTAVPVSSIMQHTFNVTDKLTPMNTDSIKLNKDNALTNFSAFMPRVLAAKAI